MPLLALGKPVKLSESIRRTTWFLLKEQLSPDLWERICHGLYDSIVDSVMQYWAFLDRPDET